MKHFVVEATYRAPIEEIRAAYPTHRAWLQHGYDRGLFLCSGPKIPATGGYLVARADSLEALTTLFEQEPFYRAGLATFTFTEFEPVKRQTWIEPWFAAEADAPVD